MLLAFVVACLHAPATQAHPLAPVRLELQERDAGVFEVAWRRPLRTRAAVERAPVLPASCTRIESLAPEAAPLYVTERFVVRCPEGLVGQRLAVAGLAESDTDALLRIAFADGRVLQRVLRPAAPALRIPEQTPATAVARDYAELGVGHILGGLDHLLFVFGLLLLVSGVRPLVRTITAFTVGHSVTLSLAVLGFVHVPQAATEVLIAASVFWLAVELARGSAGSPTLLRRRPWLVAGAFGLLHGLGFAGALAEAGLPEADIPLALFSFNVGIEAGQLAFVAAVLAAREAIRRARTTIPRWAEAVPVYAMGTLAAFWCLERALRLWS